MVLVWIRFQTAGALACCWLLAQAKQLVAQSEALRPDLAPLFGLLRGLPAKEPIVPVLIVFSQYQSLWNHFR